MAIQNVQLYRQAHILAALEERNRVAKLHLANRVQATLYAPLEGFTSLENEHQ